MKSIFAFLAVVAGITYFVGFGIKSSATLPNYGAVYLDDATKTYIALPCIRDWELRHTNTIDTLTVARLSTAGEARALGYKVDSECREAGGYVEEGRSLAGALLELLGVLDPLKHWWDQPYRTEDGTVVQPSEKAK